MGVSSRVGSNSHLQLLVPKWGRHGIAESSSPAACVFIYTGGLRARSGALVLWVTPIHWPFYEPHLESHAHLGCGPWASQCKLGRLIKFVGSPVGTFSSKLR